RTYPPFRHPPRASAQGCGEGAASALPARGSQRRHHHDEEPVDIAGGAVLRGRRLSARPSHRGRDGQRRDTARRRDGTRPFLTAGYSPKLIISHPSQGPWGRVACLAPALALNGRIVADGINPHP